MAPSRKGLLLAHMARFVFVISYNGTPFHGWQIQPNALTVQASLEQVLTKILREEIQVVGCGRTDTGVHASYYVLHFNFLGKFPMEDIAFKLNGILPSSIAVHEVYEVSEDFHARFLATSRKYTYKIHHQKNPFLENLSWFMKHEVDLDAMNAACKLLIKHNDFASFCKSGSDQESTLCDVTQAEWKQTDVGLEFTISANRFLRNMVRAIVGTLIDVGLGNTSIERFEEIIAAKNRSEAGKSAPGCGLYLSGVNYPEHGLLKRIDKWQK